MVVEEQTPAYLSEDFMAEVPGFESMFLGNLHNTVLRDVISVITRELGDCLSLLLSACPADAGLTEQFTLPLSDEVSAALVDTWSVAPGKSSQTQKEDSRNGRS
jgi:hypothetical protein